MNCKESFRKNCGVGHFANDVLLQTITEELVALRGEVEAVDKRNEPPLPDGPVAVVTSKAMEAVNVTELTLRVKEAVDQVEAKNVELDALIDKLAEQDQAFKDLILKTARTDGLLDGKKKDYSKQDIKALITRAADAGGLELLDGIAATKEAIKSAFNERHAVWDTCQREIIEVAAGRLESHISDLKIRGNVSMEDGATVVAPSAAQAVARAGILTSMATADGVWPVTGGGQSSVTGRR
eukprot:Protomagalhaensia_sp_Gyna_25__1275@NODE_163_length_4707_cov_487_270780_g126_i0_p4_GENE_NODE_163_length_4707_cov_487_270780_g126_i0NODE_163_length_4707_cov_487_270780_g126_i0_p4_ORF_typecomplete_len239_score37_49FAA_hydro_N_2/PF18288_1/0_015FAA_hydro_N_2/PF18288_1/2_9e03Hydrolase/PF00702_26/0_038Ead_Ea22/PF13935_6/1_5e02Ead_Ea22/PF13935_6/0_99Strumpellin/PF10266_9/0_14Exonuc_VII_S/PF02609_16/2_4Exonuc_VII_S/PF02609_16/1_2e03Exonuc_VII_S/PF02609_16/5_7e02_NODE_163_length_4707_cov_487_270780_g126_i